MLIRTLHITTRLCSNFHCNEQMAPRFRQIRDTSHPCAVATGSCQASTFVRERVFFFHNSQGDFSTDCFLKISSINKQRMPSQSAWKGYGRKWSPMVAQISGRAPAEGLKMTVRMKITTQATKSHSYIGFQSNYAALTLPVSPSLSHSLALSIFLSLSLSRSLSLALSPGARSPSTALAGSTTHASTTEEAPKPANLV